MLNSFFLFISFQNDELVSLHFPRVPIEFFVLEHQSGLID